jgi:hypothetical protein
MMIARPLDGGGCVSAVRGKYVNGTVVLEAAADWPDGTEVLVEPVPSGEPVGMREEDWPTTPEGVAALLQRWDAIEPLEMTPEEEAEWHSGLKAIGDYTIAHMNEGIDELFP